jgi:hypothetical protein
MPTFPLLSSGAVTQYPAVVASGQGVQVIRFLDGSDQRYLTQGKMLRRWQIRLDLLDETEIAQIETFFMAQQGDFSTFVFSDPISGSLVPNCRLAAPGLVSAYVGVDVSAVSLVVVETNG